MHGKMLFAKSLRLGIESPSAQFVLQPAESSFELYKYQTFYRKCLCINALPDPDLRYFSNSNALYLSLNAQ